MFSFAAAQNPKKLAKVAFSAVAAVVAAGLVTLGMTAPAVAVVSPGSFNTTINTWTSEGGHPIENAALTLWHFDSFQQEWTPGPTLDTNASGQLPGTGFAGLTVGDQYAVYVDVTHATDTVTSDPVTDANGWIAQSGETPNADFDGNPQDGADADTFFVAKSGAQGLPQFLTPGTAISGTIYGSDGVTATTDANEVDVYRQATDPNGSTTWSKYNSVTLNTGTDSTYSIPDLSPGTYIVEGHQSVDPTLSDITFSGGQNSFESATQIQVSYGIPATGDLTFVAAGTISGTVTLDPAVSSATPVAQVWAYPLDSHGNTGLDRDEADVANVDPSTGNYSLSVAPGNYAIEFAPTKAEVAAGYFSTWNGNSPAEQQSTKVDIAAQGDTASGIDGTVGDGVTISGTVSAAGGGDIDGIEVDLESQTGQPTLTTNTDINGFYSITAPPDSYNIEFSDPNGIYPDVFYNGENGGTSNAGLSTTISQPTGSVEADLQYSPLANLTVHVANKAGTSLAGVDVIALPVQDGSIAPNAAAVEADPVAGHAGTYQLMSLAAGVQYALYFAPPASSGAYPQYWGGSSDPGTSDLYAPPAGASSLDVTLVSSAAVSGVVTTTANKAIKGIDVDLFAFDGTQWQYEQSATTSSTGVYSFPNLATGSYTVDFDTAGESSYIGEFAGGANDPADATHVYTAAGKPATLSTHLVLGGSITGVVGGPGGTPKLPDVEVDPIILTGTPGHFTAATPDGNSSAETSSVGKFSLVGLPTGYYALSFDDFASGDDTYGNSYSSPLTNPSTPVYHVIAGKATVVPGTIDLPLLSAQQTAEVDGSLDMSAVTPLAQINGYVDIANARGEFVTEAEVDPNGNFTVDLVPGDYTYSASIFDPDNPQTRYQQQTGTISAVAGSQPLVIPVLLAAPLEFTSPVQIADTSVSVTGTTYQVSPLTWNSTTATVEYQWMRCGEVDCADPTDATPIYGATGTTYTSQGADYGSGLEVRVSLFDDYQDIPTVSDVQETTVGYATAAAPVTQSSNLFSTASPTTTLDSVAKIGVGQVAKAQPGSWNGIPGVTYSYAWVAEGGTLDGTTLGTGPTFTPTAADADAGGAVRLYVTASSLGYSTPAAEPDSTSLLILPLAAPTVKVAPKITAKLVGLNTVYTITPGTWSVAGTTPVYSWSQEGSGVVSTTNTYTYDPVPSNDPTPIISVTVGATKSGYAPGSTTLIAQKSNDNVDVLGSDAINNSVVGPVSSYATAVPIGSTFTVPPIDYAFADDSSVPTTFTYQWWHVNAVTFLGAPIKGATKSSYTVSAADLGYKLLLEVTTSSPTHLASQADFMAGIVGLRQDLIAHSATVTASAANTNAPLTKITDVLSAWGPTTLVTDSYQWLICSDGSCTDPTTSDFTPIAKATTASYIPTLAQANDTIALRVIGSKSTYASATIYGPPTLIGNGTTITAITAPSISAGLSAGKAIFNVKLTAKAGTFDVPGAAVSYQWQISTDGGSTWQNATTAANTLTTYIPGFADFVAGGNEIRVSETATKTGFTPTTASSAAAPLVGAVPAPITKPTFNTTTPGEYTVNPGTWPSAGGVGQATYDWVANGQDTGAPNTQNTYSIAAFPSSAFVTVTVTWSGGAAYASATYTLVIQKGTAPNWASPTISGTPQFGNTLSVPSVVAQDYTYPGTITGTLSYQWYSNGVAIPKATAATFAPSTPYINKTITARITATSADYATGSNLTAGVLFTAGSAQHATPTITYTGSVHTGGTVGVNISSYTLSGLTHSYQWQLSTDDVNWVSISGATKSTYVIPAADLGDHLRAVIGSSKSGYVSASDLTDDQLIVQPTVLAPITAPTVTGAGLVGTTLTANPGSWNVAATTFTYQWYRDGDIIPGATASTFAPTSDEWQEVVSVIITAHSAGYSSVTYAPNTVQIGQGAAPTSVVKPKITGAVTAGSVLTVTPGTWSVDGLTITYQWYSGTGVGTAISGATSSTYTVDESLHGSPIFVIVTVNRDGYAQGSAQSLSTANVI